MKIAVYAIALNEEQHVDRWCDSVEGADVVVVADTGSGDRTVECLRARGVTVTPITVAPWRFDVARNLSLERVPTDVDVCVCLDLDEFLLPGWRQHLESVWVPGVRQLSYLFAPAYEVDRAPTQAYRKHKIHARHGFEWYRPVHEDLRYTRGECHRASTDALLVGQRQDLSKSRSSYLDLMVLGCQEDPEDAQLRLWLGREQVYAGRTEAASETLQAYLRLSNGNDEERSEACRLLAMTHPEDALHWLQRAIGYAHWRVPVWREWVHWHYVRGDWLGVLRYALEGLEKGRRTGSYLDDAATLDYALHDYAALALSELGRYDEAVQAGARALALAPGDERLARNLQFFRSRREATRIEQRIRSAADATASDVGTLIEAAVSAPYREEPRAVATRAATDWTVHVIAPQGCGPARCFIELAESVTYGLRALGLTVACVTSPPVQPAHAILIGAHLLTAAQCAAVPQGVVVYNTEHIDSRVFTGPPSRGYDTYRALLQRSVVWDYSDDNARALTMALRHPVRYVPMGYVAQFSRLKTHALEDIDVLFYGAAHPRRLAVLERLAADGFAVTYAEGAFGAVRDQLIARAKVVLNMHYHLPGAFEICRVGYLLANQKAVVSERNAGEASAMDLSGGLLEVPYDRLVESTRHLIKDPASRRALQQKGFERFKARDQAAILRDALAGMIQ